MSAASLVLTSPGPDSLTNRATIFRSVIGNFPQNPSDPNPSDSAAISHSS